MHIVPADFEVSLKSLLILFFWLVGTIIFGLDSFIIHDVVSINGGEKVCVQVLQQEVPVWEVSWWPHQDSHDE